MVGQSLPQKWPKFVFGVPQGSLNGSRTRKMDSNQSGAVGDVALVDLGSGNLSGVDLHLVQLQLKSPESKSTSHLCRNRT